MIDAFLLAELAWCTVWLRRQGLSTILLYAGGLLAAGYTAMHLSAWLAARFGSPSNPAFLWLETHLTEQVQSVTTVASLMPPVPAYAGVEHSQWIALHLVKTFLFIAITVAIFVLFVVVNQLTTALWDWPSDGRDQHLVVATLAAAVCGIYLCVLTVVFTANLTWIRNFSGVANTFSHSVSIHLFSRSIHVVQGWLLP